LNKRLPRLTCSVVKTTAFPALSSETVRVASSNSIAKALNPKEKETKETKKI